MVKEKEVEKYVKIANKNGIHVRPAAYISKKLQEFKSDIFVYKEGSNYPIKAKSAVDLLANYLVYGSNIKIVAQGEDAEEAIEEAVNLFTKEYTNFV